MPTQIFINLSVSDLPASITFYESLGFTLHPQFTNEEAACLVISDVIFAMLHRPSSFSRFTPLPICDARRSTEVLLAISCESREAVDALVEKAVAGGGSLYRDPEDHGFMYGHGFKDLDGHIWEPFHMVATPENTQ